jgi:hypothetical protein
MANNNREYQIENKTFLNVKFLPAECNINTGSNMSNDDTEEEASFREKYAQELQKKKQQGNNSYRGDDELVDERRRVNQQGMRTPGRRGEKIKQEELDKEFVRRSKAKADRL